MDHLTIQSDEVSLQAIKEITRPRYEKLWKDFKQYTGQESLNNRVPSEDEILAFMRHLRDDKGMASSTMWTSYSQLNGVVKSKYGFNLKKYARVTTLLKSMDTDIKKKASVFTKEELDKFIGAKELGTPYWIVRKGIVLCSFFGGLRHAELMDLKLERVVSTKNGVSVTHNRAKQRSDKLEAKFLIPRASNQGQLDYAKVMEHYLEYVRNDLGKVTGRLWFTGNHRQFVNLFLGKNMVGKIPHELATFLELSDPDSFTFHSFRRSSASQAADLGTTSLQMQSYYGWKNASMTLEYVSTSKAAIEDMANKLAHSEVEEKVTGPNSSQLVHSEVEEKVTGPNSSQLMTSQVTDDVPVAIGGDITRCIDGKQKVYIFQ